MKVPVPHSQAESLAAALRAARATRALSAKEFRALHARFRFTDVHYRVWTFGLNSRAWHRLAGTRWVPQEPRGELRIDKRIHDRLGKLRPAKRSKPSGPEWSGGNVAPARMEALARTLRHARASKRISDVRFKDLHKRFFALDEQGRRWTFSLLTAKWHRAERGRWVARIPPGKLQLEDSVLRAIEAFPPPKAARPGKSVPSPPPPPQPPQKSRSALNQCPRCGAPAREGLKFCKSCGASLAGSPAKPAAKSPPPAPVPSAPRCRNPQCGKTVPPGKKFCPSCGTSLK